MASRPKAHIDLKRILRAASPRTDRARLRIMIATDPHRPIRTFTLPRALPTVVTIAGAALLVGTLVLLLGSWRIHGSRAQLENRVRAMVAAADTLALHPLQGDPGESGWEASRSSSMLTGTSTGLRPPRGQMGHFMIESSNNGENMEVRFNLLTGELEPACYRQFRHLMRCLHTGAETPPDPRLIELLYQISERTHQKILLVSGFRAPMFSLATLSYHTRGMAADIRIPGMTALMVRDLVMSMGVKGIGFYPVSQFVHVDVREERQYWIDYSSRQKGETEGAEHGPERGEVEIPLAEQPQPQPQFPAAAAAGDSPQPG